MSDSFPTAAAACEGPGTCRGKQREGLGWGGVGKWPQCPRLSPCPAGITATGLAAASGSASGIPWQLGARPAQ